MLVSHRPELLAVCDRLLTIDPVLAPAVPDREPLAPEVLAAPVGADPRPPGCLGPDVRHAATAGALRWSLPPRAASGDGSRWPRCSARSRSAAASR